MNVKTLDRNKSLFLLGDIHGDWNELFFQIQEHDIKNSYIVSVGDLGIGFKYKKEHEYKQSENLNNQFKQRDNIFYGIRGNHDDPSFFKGNNRLVFSNFELLEDYTTAKYGDSTIQLIGGAVSIDRTGRKKGVSYWEDEGVVFERESCKKVDVLITHTAPSFCYPQTFNEMVYSWAREDAYLLEELTDERAVMDEIFKICQPSKHFYGHFHHNYVEKIQSCTHRLLNIDELFLLTL